MESTDFCTEYAIKFHLFDLRGFRVKFVLSVERFIADPFFRNRQKSLTVICECAVIRMLEYAVMGMIYPEYGGPAVFEGRSQCLHSRRKVPLFKLTLPQQLISSRP